jgi:hypothetical protein
MERFSAGSAYIFSTTTQKLIAKGRVTVCVENLYVSAHNRPRSSALRLEELIKEFVEIEPAKEQVESSRSLIESHISDSCRFRKSRYPGDGARLWRGRMYLATVRAETLNPNLASSAWIRH